MPVAESSSWRSRVIHWPSSHGSWTHCTETLADQRKRTAVSFIQHSRANYRSRVRSFSPRRLKTPKQSLTRPAVRVLVMHVLMLHYDCAFWQASSNANILCYIIAITGTKSPFLFLALELPPPPLFQEELEKNIIPQIPLTTILSKYDGRTVQVYATAPFLLSFLTRCQQRN